MECCLGRQSGAGCHVDGTLKTLRIEDGNFRMNSSYVTLLPLGNMETHNSETVTFVINSNFFT